MLRLLRQGRLSKWFGIGQEAIAVACHGAAGRRSDPADAPQPRRLHGRGLDLLQLFRQLLGRTGASQGPGPDLPFRSLRTGCGHDQHLGAMLRWPRPALAASLRGEDRVVAAFTGDGATSEGDFTKRSTWRPSGDCPCSSSSRTTSTGSRRR